MALYAIWQFMFDGGDDDSWRYGWTGVLALVAAAMATTARLLARMPHAIRLAAGAGLLAGAAATVSVVAVWQDDPGDGIGKTIAALWIVATLAYLLVPVLQRFTAAAAPADERVLAEMDGVELVATRAREGMSIDLVPGERLLLRRRA
jgi:hypothetical protein